MNRSVSLRESLRESRPVEWVSFDAGGTLLEPWPSVGVVYAEGAARAGWGRLDPDVLEARFRAAWKARGDFDYSRRAWAGLVAATFSGLVPEPADPRLFAELYDSFARAARWRVYPDVRPCLDALAARGLRLLVLSNWDERLRPLLAEAGLDRAFAEVVVSGEVGFHKPDPRLFAWAAERVGAAPDRILHVGDSRSEDWFGATAAGWRALLLERRPDPVAGVDPAFVIRSLSEVPGHAAAPDDVDLAQLS